MAETGLVGGSGIIEPAERESRLAVGAAGVVSEIKVKEGDRVQKGDTLLLLDSSVEEASVKSAEADLANARAAYAKTLHGQRVEDRAAARSEAQSAKARSELSDLALTRAEKLTRGGAMTQEELDRARLTAAADKRTSEASEARARAAEVGSRSEDIAAAKASVVSAEMRLQQAIATLDRRRIRAPFSGEILQVRARIGEYYTPGAGETPVTLGDTSRLRVRMDVDERDIGRVEIGQSASVAADSFKNEKFSGKVVEMARRMGRKNVRTDDPTERIDTKILEVVIELDSAQKLVPGLRVKSFIRTEK
jgi:ABC exporter DevB family membrane fusion protein